ncbi:hypothetical protein ACFLUG_02220 [Chloroflexota bacterium]
MSTTKLVCDRCGYEVTDPEVIEQMVPGMDAWMDAQKSRGEAPRGLFPCKNYVRCQGQLRTEE